MKMWQKQAEKNTQISNMILLVQHDEQALKSVAAAAAQNEVIFVSITEFDIIFQMEF